MSNFLRLSSLEMEIMGLLTTCGASFDIELMNCLNVGKQQCNLPLISDSFFSPTLHKLQREGLLNLSLFSDSSKKYCQATSLGEQTYRVNLKYEAWVNEDMGRENED